MGTKNSKVNITFERSIYTTIKNLSEKENIPMSSIIRDLVKEALELREDIVLSKFAEDREKTFNKSKVLSHQEVWR